MFTKKLFVNLVKIFLAFRQTFDTTSGAFDPKNYNENIASASMALAFSGMYLRANEEAVTYIQGL